MHLPEDCWSEFKIKVNAIMHFLSENYTTFNNSIIKGYVYITKYGIFFFTEVAGFYKFAFFDSVKALLKSAQEYCCYM